MTVEAPQFVKISLNEIEIAAPIERGTPEFEQAAILQTAAEYALQGMQGFFKVEDNSLWGFAFTDKSIDPKAYVLGILQDGHKNMATTQRYIDLRPGVLRKAVELV